MRSFQNLAVCLMFGLFFLLAPIDDARAYKGATDECMNNCMNTYNCSTDYVVGTAFDADSDCAPYVRACDAACVVQDKQIYGALAYDQKTGGWGIADRSGDQEAANLSALLYCRQYSKSCTVIARFKSTCAAISYAEDNSMAWSKGDTKLEAEKAAQASCASKTSSPCSIKNSNCYGK